MIDMDLCKKSSPEAFSYANISTHFTLLFTIYCFITGFLILHFRHWDPEILKQCLGIMSYPIFLFGTVALAVRRESTSQYVIPLCLVTFMLFPIGVNLIGSWVLAPLFFLGISFTAWSCLVDRDTFCSNDLMKILMIGIFLPFFYFFVVNGCGYADIYSDLKGLQGTLHKDTLFHSAIINMIARFGVPSTGIDGLVPIAYHTGVHRWVAANLLLLGGETPILLSITKQIALIPVFFFTVAHVVTKLSNRSSHIMPAIGIIFSIFWLTDSRLWNSYLLSESYMFSLPLFIAILPVGKSLIARSFETKQLSLEFIIALIAVAVCWTAKISTAIILGVYLTACVLIPMFLENPKHYILLIFPLIIICTFCLWLISQYYYGISFTLSPFHFAHKYTAVFLWQIVIFCFSIAIIYFLIQKREQYMRKLIVLTLLVTFFAGQMPIIFFDLGSGAGYYFSNPALLVAIIYAASILLNRVQNRPIEGSNFLFEKSFRNIFHATKALGKYRFRFGGLFLMFSLIIVLTTSADSKNYFKYIRKFIALQQEISSSSNPSEQLKKHRGNYSFSGKFYNLLFPPKINYDLLLSTTPIGRIKRSINNLRLSKTDKSIAIYISPDYQEFWSSKRRCWASPFLVPAMVGLPLLNGVRSGYGSCEPTQNYGMKDYGKFSLNCKLSARGICKKADKLGFSKIYEFSNNEDQLYLCHIIG